MDLIPHCRRCYCLLSMGAVSCVEDCVCVQAVRSFHLIAMIKAADDYVFVFKALRV